MQLLQNNQAIGKLKINILYLSVITLITALSWIGFSVYQSFSKNTIDITIQKIIKPINPNLDTSALSEFKSTRSSAPKEFQIISISRQNNQTTHTIIDPFNNRKELIPIASSSTLPVASSSTEMVP